MVETIVQIAGMGWCVLCLGCIVWSFGSYIIGSSKSQDEELLDNMNKMKK